MWIWQQQKEDWHYRVGNAELDCDKNEEILVDVLRCFRDQPLPFAHFLTSPR